MEKIHKPLDFILAFKGAFVASIIALLLFGPIMGLVLSGYDYQAELQRPLIAAVVVFVGRF